MPIRIACSCGKRLNAPDSLAGKIGKCPACGRRLVIPVPGPGVSRAIAVPPGPPEAPASAPAAPPPVEPVPPPAATAPLVSLGRPAAAAPPPEVPAPPLTAPPPAEELVPVFEVLEPAQVADLRPAPTPIAAGPASPLTAPPPRRAPARGPTRTLDLSLLRTPSESVLRGISLAFTILIYLLLLVGTFGLGLIYVGMAMLASYVMLAFMMCHVRGNGIRVGPDQLPEVYESARRAAEALGLPEVPAVYVVQEWGLLNAFATKFAFRQYVVLFSDLIDACGDPRQLDMIMAHEMGHLALNHIMWLWVLLPARLVPFLAQAYSRACEYSADRCGWAGCGDTEAATRGLLVLAAGGKHARMASLEAFLRQSREVGGFWQTFVELFSTHPWLTRRAEALQDLASSGAAA